jgi:AcrR family transcriptional regulator
VDTDNINLQTMLAMSTSFATNMKMSVKRSYHHGNLRKALLDAGVALIGEVGPKGFTIREVARRAGVSHNAPYRHFRDKDELLEAIAVEGFERLTAAMKKRSGAGVTAAGRLRLCGCGYVDFALRWPQHFLVMFDLPYRENPKHDTVAENAFQTLLGFIIESQKEGALPEGDPHPLALMAWSMVHGIAKLAISGKLPYSSKQVLDFTQIASEAFVSGMRNLKQPRNSNKDPAKRGSQSKTKKGHSPTSRTCRG